MTFFLSWYNTHRWNLRLSSKAVESKLPPIHEQKLIWKTLWEIKTRLFQTWIGFRNSFSNIIYKVCLENAKKWMVKNGLKIVYKWRKNCWKLPNYENWPKLTAFKSKFGCLFSDGKFSHIYYRLLSHVQINCFKANNVLWMKMTYFAMFLRPVNFPLEIRKYFLLGA